MVFTQIPYLLSYRIFYLNVFLRWQVLQLFTSFYMDSLILGQ